MSSWSRALDTLVRERGPALFGYAFVLTGNRVEAEDLVHDALVRTFRRGRATGSIDSAHAYVKHAITSAFIDGGRRVSTQLQRTPGDVADIAMPASAAHAQTRTTLGHGLHPPKGVLGAAVLDVGQALPQSHGDLAGLAVAYHLVELR